MRMTATVLWLTVLAFVPFLLPVCAEAFCFEEAGNIHGINPSLLRSIARIESGMNPKAVNVNKNGSTDLGLMQINSSWIEPMQLYRKDLLSNPCYNVKTGARILRECIDRLGYTWQAVGCYNAVTKSRQVDYSWKIYRVLKREEKRNKRIVPSDNITAESAQKNQALYFRVKSVEGTDNTGEP